MKRSACVFLLALTLLCLMPSFDTFADQATDISSSVTIVSDGFESTDFLTDGDKVKHYSSVDSTFVTLTSAIPMKYIYIIFDNVYGSYLVRNNTNGDETVAGTLEMLHECIELSDEMTSVTLCFEHGSVRMSEIYVFTAGELPSFVQRFNAPYYGNTDLLILATHCDDDQLFFAGMIPTYINRGNCNIQVMYFTDHTNRSKRRRHESLDALWAEGITSYPIFAPFKDFRIDSLERTYIQYKEYGVTKEDMQKFLTEKIRLLKPQVIAAHDINGEYGHGMHRVYTDTLIGVIDHTADENFFPASAQKYGTWNVKKTYIHLYSDNPTVMDYDTPLEYYDGMTAFEVAQKIGFPCHSSQQDTLHTSWIYGENGEITKASQIGQYSPCIYGLYRTSVGQDVEKNDLLENIETYPEKAQREAKESDERSTPSDPTSSPASEPTMSAISSNLPHEQTTSKTISEWTSGEYTARNRTNGIDFAVAIFLAAALALLVATAIAVARKHS